MIRRQSPTRRPTPHQRIATPAPSTRRQGVPPVQSFAAVLLLGAGVLVSAGLAGSVQAQDDGMVEVPYFEVDPYWPLPLPNHWILGSAVGVGVDVAL